MALGCLSQGSSCSGTDKRIGGDCCQDLNGNEICDRYEPNQSAEHPATTVPGEGKPGDDNPALADIPNTRQPPPTTLANSKTENLAYDSPAYGMSLKYPGDWVYVEYYTDKIAVFVPPEDAREKNGRPMLLITASNNQAESFIESEERLAQVYDSSLRDLKLEDSTMVIIDREIAMKRVFTYKYKTGKVKGVQYMVPTRGYTYFLTYSGSERLYDKYSPQIDAIAMSFTVTSTPKLQGG